MSDYIGTITGIIGACTGIYGAVMGHRAYQHSKSVKALDLRLALRKDLSDAHALVASLRTLLDYANKSRKAVMSATGMLRSGSEIIWDRELAADRAEMERLSALLHSEQHDWSTSNNEQLETELVNIHAKKRDLTVIEAKYKAAIAEDDARRAEIRQNMNDRVNQQLAAQPRQGQ